MMYTVYIGSQILRTEFTDTLILSEEEEYIEGDYDGGTYYMVGNMPMVRPKMLLDVSHVEEGSESISLQAGMDELAITGIPQGTTVIHPGGDYVEDGGAYLATFMYPGTYMIVLENFPYLSETFYVQVRI